MVEAGCDDDMILMNCNRGTSTTHVAFAVTIILLAIAAVILIPTTLINRSGLESISVSASSEASGFCSTPPCSQLITSWLHTNPGQTEIFDGNGNAVRLIGLNVMGLEFGTGTSVADSCRFGWGGEDAGWYSTNEFDNIASWGFNFVRLPISWENMEPTAPTQTSGGTWIHNWNQEYLSEIDYFVKQLGQRHIAVILDFSQVDLSPAFQNAPGGVHGSFCEGWGEPTWLYPGINSATSGQQLGSAMCDFFMDKSMVGAGVPAPIEGMEAAEAMIASRYSSNPTVIGVDMFNEPWFPQSCGSISVAAGFLMNYNSEMAKAIYAANPHILIVFEDVIPGIMPHHISPILTAPPPVPNAVYSLHVYTSGWATAEPLLQAYLGNAVKWGVPLYLGEFNAFEAGNNAIYAKVDPNWQIDTQAMLAYCQSNGISWSFFSYTSLGTSVSTPVPKTEILAVLQSGI